MRSYILWFGRLSTYVNKQLEAPTDQKDNRLPD